MQAFNFKLAPAILALRVCKPKGGRRFVTCLGAKDFRWPKDLSGGPEATIHTGGLVKAQPVATVSSISEGTLVKPNSLKGVSVGQSTWVIGKSSRGITRGDSGSPMTATMPESVACAFALNGDPIQVASMVSLPVRLVSDHPDEVASATEISKLGFIGEEVTNRRKRDETHTPIAGDLSVGTTMRPMGPGFDVSSDH